MVFFYLNKKKFDFKVQIVRKFAIFIKNDFVIVFNFGVTAVGKKSLKKAPIGKMLGQKL